MRRPIIIAALSATFLLASCGSDAGSPAAPDGSSPGVSTGQGNSTDSTINGRAAPDANGNNNDAPYVSTPGP